MRAGWGAFLGNLVAIGLKMAFSAALIIIYIKEMIS
jgi:hypothetical protein